MTSSHSVLLAGRPLVFAILAGLALGGCNKPPATAVETGAAAETAPAQSPSDLPAPVATIAEGGPTGLAELDAAARSTALKASGMCNFQKLNGETFAAGTPGQVREPGSFVIAGWVGDKLTMTRPDADLRLTQIDGGRVWEIGVGPGQSRPGVARIHRSEGLKAAGFEVKADLSALPPGEYALSLVHDRGKNRVACDKGARLVIGG